MEQKILASYLGACKETAPKGCSGSAILENGRSTNKAAPDQAVLKPRGPAESKNTEGTVLPVMHVPKGINSRGRRPEAASCGGALRTEQLTGQIMVVSIPAIKEIQSHLLSNFKKSKESQAGRCRKCPMAMKETEVRRIEVMKSALL